MFERFRPVAAATVSNSTVRSKLHTFLSPTKEKKEREEEEEEEEEGEGGEEKNSQKSETQVCDRTLIQQGGGREGRMRERTDGRIEG